jgi:hypothetical protein
MNSDDVMVHDSHNHFPNENNVFKPDELNEPEDFFGSIKYNSERATNIFKKFCDDYTK